MSNEWKMSNIQFEKTFNHFSITNVDSVADWIFLVYVTFNKWLNVFKNCIFDFFAFVGHMFRKYIYIYIVNEYKKIKLGSGWLFLCNLWFIVSTISRNMF